MTKLKQIIGIDYNTIITELGDHSVPKNWEQFVVKRGKGETPGPPIIWSDPQDPEDAQPGYGFIPDETTDEETFFYHSDHLGSTSYITDQDGNVTQYTAYLPYGELLVDEHSSSEDLPYKFNGKELDEETGLYYYGARYLNPVSSIWYGTDPLMEKYPSLSAYVYCAGNPVKLVDEDGNEPIKPQAGTVSGFVQFLNNTVTKMGTLKGTSAIHAMERLAKIKMDKGIKPVPATTAPFNLQKDRYIYTEVGGWIDMSHFMFYAGRAFVHKQEIEKAQKFVSQMSHNPFIEIPLALYKIANSNPVGEALQEGYMQEKGDKFFAPHSAYSYEDLPTDRFAAEFGANHFNPHSDLSLGEQLANYLNNVLKATSPDKAPNYKDLPQQTPKNKPTRQNYTAQPVYTKENP